MKFSMFSKKVLAIAGILGLGLVTPALADDHTAVETDAEASEIEAEDSLAQVEAESSIAEIVAGVEEFSTLEAALEAADLVEALSGDGPFTVFAPTNDAFAALPDGVVDALLLPENQDLLTDVLTYHVIPDEVASDELETGSVPALNGDDLNFTIDNDMALVNDIPIVAVDIPATNGLVHVIQDGVLVPESVATELESRLAEAEEPTPPVETTLPAETTPPVEETTASEEPVRGLW